MNKKLEILSKCGNYEGKLPRDAYFTKKEAIEAMDIWAKEFGSWLDGNSFLYRGMSIKDRYQKFLNDTK